MENSNKTLEMIMNALEKDTCDIDEFKNTRETIQELKKEILQEKPPYKTIEYGNTIIEQNITKEDLENKLMYDETTITLERIILITIKGMNQYGVMGTINVGANTINIMVPLSQKQSREFLMKYSNKSINCKAEVTYCKTLDIFSIFHLEIYNISSPMEKWTEVMRNKPLKERIEFIIKIFGVNPDKMLYHEKIIFIFRIIPLVVKKFLMVELSKKEIGKTEIYSSLNFLPYTLLVTRAGMFVDGRNGKGGDFFDEDITFIIDELTKINDPEVITALQVYMNGNKYKGKIQINSKETRETDISPILLGNVKQGNFDFSNLFSENKNIFDNTVISSEDGEAFVSRINGILNSWGCRTFSSDMKLETGIEFYNLEVLKAVIPLLREKELNTSRIYETIGIQRKSPSIRAQESVEKSFEGLFKLLYPEFIDTVSSHQLQQIYNELMFLYERAVEMRKVVDNQLKIINPNSNKELTFPDLNTQLRNVMFTIKEPHYFTPHRIFIECGDGNIKKIPLDAMGIEMNKREIEILEEFNVKNYDNNNNQLIHNSNYTRNYLLQNNRSFNSIGFPLAVQSSQSYGNVNLSPTNISKITKEINYNYLTGEYENLELHPEWINYILEHSFYDLSY